LTVGLLDQLPRFSEYDPGAVGEGSLDPLGLGAVAERIADRLAPGLRARMSHPRFVTISAVGAFACQGLQGVVSSDEKTTFDIAFEWLVVESLVRFPGTDRLRGVPGSQKAQRAAKLKQRMNAAAYLAGPRNFGFTGVYRPFSQDALVLAVNGMPAENAEELLLAWEADQGLDGFVSGGPGSLPGAGLRREIAKDCADALSKGRCSAPPTGWFMRRLADVSAPGEAGRRERAVLRHLIARSRHEVRDELTALLSGSLPAKDTTQLDIARILLARSRGATRDALHAAIEFENCATAIDNTFRRMLAYGTSFGGAFTVTQGAATPRLAELATRLGGLTRSAIDAVARLDEALAHETVDCMRNFDHSMAAERFVEALVARHQQVQDAKGKRMWLDPLKQKWVVRAPYRKQDPNPRDEEWTHPMRLLTLVSFLRATA